MMKKFEEEVRKNGGGCFEVFKNGKTTYEIQGLTSSPLIIFGDWVSPEDHQAEVGKIELQNLKYREEIARMQKALRKKNKAIKELNGAVKKSKARLKECEDLRIEANNDAAIEYSRKCEVVKDRAELKRENQRLRNLLEAAGETSKELLDINKKLRGDLGDALGKLRGAEDYIKQLKSQLEKQQALPEIPQFVATEIERLKSEGIKTLCDFYNCDVDWMTFGMEDLRGDEFAVAKWFYHNTETFELAYSYGYTVAKEKRFYLKDDRELESVGDTCIGYVTLYLKNDGYLTTDKTRAGKFTQSQIDSMDTGSYERIEVTE